jgi:hypothetical protein
MSGIMAAHLPGVVRQAAPPEPAATAYRRWPGEWFAADVARLKEF